MSQHPPERHPPGLPAHPEHDDDAVDGRRTTTNWWTVVLFGLIGAAIVALLVLHLIGILGPAGHR